MDLDGTLISGFERCPGSEKLLAQLGARYVIASNNSTHTCREMSKMLHSLGLHVPADRIVLAGIHALETLARERAGQRVLLLANKSLRDHARSLDIRCVEEEPDVVVLARDTNFSYEKLALATRSLSSGADLVVTNPDLTHPGTGAVPVPETGSLLRALLACSNPKSMRVIGKPSPDLFQEAISRLGLRAEQCTVVGDNPDTDGKGAFSLGLRFLHVGPDPAADYPGVKELSESLNARRFAPALSGVRAR